MIKYLLLLASVSGALFGCQDTESPSSVSASLKVVRGDLVFQPSLYGELVPVRSESVYVPSLTDMWQVTIDTIKPDGTLVKKGEEILRFDTSEVASKLEVKQAELSIQEAELRKLQDTLEKERINVDLQVQRLELLVKRARLSVVEGVDFISKLELSKAKIDVSRARLELQLARRARKAFSKKRNAALNVRKLRLNSVKDKVEEYRENMGKMVLRAPSDGVVLAPYTRLFWSRKKAEPGVVARPGDKVLELPDLSAFQAELYVRQREAALLTVGDEAIVYATTNSSIGMKAKITHKDAFTTTRNERFKTKKTEGNLKEVKVTLSLTETPPGLTPGGTVRADVNTVLAKDVLQVPLTCLKAEGTGYTVVMTDGSERKISVGKSSSTHAEILSGLAEGETVRIQ